MFLIEFLDSFHWICGALFAVGFLVAITMAAILLVRKFVQRKHLRESHDVAGFVFANLGVLFSVLLGFTVVNVQQRFDKIQENTEVEASYLEELYQDAEVFVKSEREKIQQAIKKYIQDVIEDEWPLMPKGEVSAQATESLKEVWKSYYDTNPAGPKQEAWYGESIGKLNQLTHTRLTRVLGGKESLSAEMWTLLILGSLGVVMFICFFGMESTALHLLMGATLAASTAFLLFLIHTLDSAFCGTVRVSPEALIRVLESIN
jgi:hypothetical protein